MKISKLFENKKLIVFDFDDTLVKTTQCKWQALKETAKKKYALEITDNDIKLHWGKPFELMLTEVFKNIDNFENLNNQYKAITKEHPMFAHKGATKLVNFLINKNYKVAILTSSSRDHVLEDLKHAGFDISKFFRIYTSEDSEFHKPDSRVFNNLLEDCLKVGTTKEEVLYIGDSIKDHIASKNAKINFIGVLQGMNTHEEFVRVKAVFVDSVDTLLTILRNECK